MRAKSLPTPLRIIIFNQKKLHTSPKLSVNPTNYFSSLSLFSPMSRHRRQGSQVIPPDLFSGDDPLRPPDSTQASSAHLGQSTTNAAAQSSKNKPNSSTTADQEQKKSPAFHSPSAPPNSKPPPAT